MGHDIIQGILSGLIGPVIAKWASRFKYGLVFLASVIGLHLYALARLVITDGWHNGLEKFLYAPPSIIEDIFVSIGVGLLAVFVVFLSTIGGIDKKE